MTDYLDTTKKHFYAGYSYMGTNFTYDSPCWRVFVFDTKKERDVYVDNNLYNDQGNIVMENVSSKLAFKIVGVSKYNHPSLDYKGDITELSTMYN